MSGCPACMATANGAPAFRVRFAHTCGAGETFPEPAPGQLWRSPWGQVYGPVERVADHCRLPIVQVERTCFFGNTYMPVERMRADGWELLWPQSRPPFTAVFPDAVPWRTRASPVRGPEDVLAAALVANGASDTEAADVLAAEVARLGRELRRLLTLRVEPIKITVPAEPAPEE